VQSSAPFGDEGSVKHHSKPAQVEVSAMARLTLRALAVNIILLSLAAARPAPAQRDNDPLQGTFFEITGQVRLPDGRATANDVPVRLEMYGGGLIDHGTTDSVGRFRFTRLRRAQYTVVVRVPGYREERQSVDISVVGRAHVILQLAADPAAPRRGPAAEVVDATVPPAARDEFEKGLAAASEKKSRQAVAHFEKAVQLHPNFFAAHAALAAAHMEAAAWDRAESALRRALQLRPESVPELVSLGEVHRRKKQLKEAAEVLQKAVKLDDASWQGHFTLGRVYWETGDFARAGRQAGRTLQLRPDYAEAHLLGGNVFMRFGQPENALVEYEEYLRLAPRGEFAAHAQDLVNKLRKQLAEKKK
jgi:tetratricopeptide (TPR) repeat protein